MANHLTPEELSKELGIDRQEVIRVCVEEGVPIYQGKIDKTLFQAQLEALGAVRGSRTSGVGTTCAAARFLGAALLARGRLLGAVVGFAPSTPATLCLQRLHQVDDRRVGDRLRHARSPRRPASPRASRAGSRRYSLCELARAPTRRRGSSISCRASSSSGSLTSIASTASSISACERTSSAKKSVSSTSASPFGRIRQKFSLPRMHHAADRGHARSPSSRSAAARTAGAAPRRSTGARKYVRSK